MGHTEKQTDRRVKYKIWIILLISLFASLAVCYWSYISFTTLTQSIDQLSLPNEKIDLINETFQEIIEAENHIHSYILTDDTLSRWIYRKKTESARLNINRLINLLHDDSAQAKRVDSLQVLFNTKLKYLRAFLKVKKEKRSSLFVNEALGHIARKMNDTALIEKQLMKSEVLKGQLKPVKKQEVIITPDEYKGFGGFVRKLFGGDKTRIDTVNTIEEELFFIYDVSVDTSIVKDYFRDSTLLKVKSILSRFRSREIDLQQQLTQKELGLLQQNQMFISNIRLLMKQLRKQERANTLHKKVSAKAVADRSMRVIFFIGFIGLLLSAVFVFFILRDVTRSLYYRRQLENEKTRALKLAKIKEEFLSNMSHEIRTPLQSILGFSSLLQQTRMDGRQKEYLGAINHSNAYLTALVNNILDQAKIEAGKLNLVNKPFAVSKIADELRSVFSYTILEKGLQFDVFVADDLKHCHLFGDEFRIKQLLNNLLGNAIKFTQAGSIGLKMTGTKHVDTFDLEIQISDTGMGIAEHKLTAIFDQFVQEDDGISKNYGGTGLGLSIVKGLTEAMGGEVSVKSKQGKGTTFTISLSLPYLDAKDDLSYHEDPVEMPYVDANVIIVEDDTWNAVLLQEILQSRVQDVLVFRNAPEALDYIKKAEKRIDLIFTDIKMPEMSGDTFMEQVKAIGIASPIVALTAHIQPDKLRKLVNKGFSHVCSKPYSIADIENILKHVFETDQKVAGGLNQNEKLQGIEEARHEALDLSMIRAFSGDDQAVFEKLLNELVENNQKQVEAFLKHFAKKDFASIAALSHQMKTTYDNLKLSSISEQMAAIELYENLGQKERVIECAGKVCPELSEILTALQKIRRQYHIV